MNAHYPSLIASSLPLAESVPSPASALSLSTGFLVIAIGALIVLARLVSDLRARVCALENARENSPPPAPVALTPAPPPPAALPSVRSGDSADTISPDVLAVIAAAIHVTLGREARIVGVTPARIEDHTWSLEGRRQIFHSHKVR
jgi:hypothetical protein